MKKTSSFVMVMAPLLGALGALPIFVQPARAQRSTDVFPVANTVAAPEPDATPATLNDASAHVENPPPPAPVDPNAPIETEILASKGANFVSQDRIAVFEGDVRVNDPRFQIACDKLTVFLAKGTTPDAGKNTDPAPNTPARGTGAQSSPAGGIDHARAVGHVIIIQKRAATKAGEEAKTSMGRADEVDFDNKTGDMVLRGTPSIEQNGNRHIALSPSTVMTLHRDNSMDTEGPNRTVFTSKNGGGGFDVPGAPPNGTKPAGGKPKKGSGNPRG